MYDGVCVLSLLNKDMMMMMMMMMRKCNNDTAVKVQISEWITALTVYMYVPVRY